jgi:hypothetical protein
MKLILFGATGMVGSGALREALADPGVEAVLAVGRRYVWGDASRNCGSCCCPISITFAAVRSRNWLVGMLVCGGFGHQLPWGSTRNGLTRMSPRI